MKGVGKCCSLASAMGGGRGYKDRGKDVEGRTWEGKVKLHWSGGRRGISCSARFILGCIIFTIPD